MIITGQTRDKKNFTVYAPDSMVEMLNSQYIKNDIKIEYVAPSNNSIWISIIPSALIILLFLVFIFFFTQQSQGGGSGKGVMNLFKEIAGADEDTCVSCLIKEALYIAYDLGYEDAILSVEE